MKVGKATHIDPGAMFGVLLSILGTIPEVVSSPSFHQVVPEKYAHILILIGVVITSMRGQLVRREQYREEEVFSIPPTDLHKKPPEV